MRSPTSSRWSKTFALAYPALTGLAVDGLLKRDYRGLYALVAVWLLYLAISFGRQRYDTRVFMRLYARIASHMVGEQYAKGYDTSLRSIVRDGAMRP